MNTNKIAREAAEKLLNWVDEYIAPEEWKTTEKDRMGATNIILSAIIRAREGLYYCDGNGYHEIKHKSSSRAAPASAEQQAKELISVLQSFGWLTFERGSLGLVEQQRCIEVIASRFVESRPKKVAELQKNKL